MVLLKPLFLLCKNDRAMLGTKSADDTSNEKEVRNIKQKQQPKLKLSGKTFYNQIQPNPQTRGRGILLINH